MSRKTDGTFEKDEFTWWTTRGDELRHARFHAFRGFNKHTGFGEGLFSEHGVCGRKLAWDTNHGVTAYNRCSDCVSIIEAVDEKCKVAP